MHLYLPLSPSLFPFRVGTRCREQAKAWVLAVLIIRCVCLGKLAKLSESLIISLFI